MGNKIATFTQRTLFGIGIVLCLELSTGCFGKIGDQLQLSPFIVIHAYALKVSCWIANVTLLFVLLIALQSFFKKGLVYGILHADSLDKTFDTFKVSTEYRVQQMQQKQNAALAKLEEKHLLALSDLNHRQDVYRRDFLDLWSLYEIHTRTLFISTAKCTREISQIACSTPLRIYFTEISALAETMLRKFNKSNEEQT